MVLMSCKRLQGFGVQLEVVQRVLEQIEQHEHEEGFINFENKVLLDDHADLRSLALT